jgi:hypothetical protein
MIKIYIEYSKDNLENDYLTYIGKNNINNNFIYMTKQLNNDDIYSLLRIIKIKKLKKIDFTKELFLLEFNTNRSKYLTDLFYNGIIMYNSIQYNN